MKKLIFTFFKKPTVAFAMVFSSFGVFGQTNVYDDIIALSPNHTTLKAALIQANLVGALQNPNATLTVFAPDNAAFDALATALGTTTSSLLLAPNLADILTYHVLFSTVGSVAITNGQIATSANTTSSGTIFLTKTSMGSVFADQASVTIADILADNGVVHVLNSVLLPVPTVVDVAVANNFTTLTAALIQEELLPVLTNPLGTFTVFAPTNAAFDALATALGTDINGILALPTLKEVLKYHVLGAEVLSTAITNGQIVASLSNLNTLKLTKTTTGSVFINQAQVTTANVDSDNGVVHVLNNVLLPFETVADIAIDNSFTTLVAAVVKAELLPALSNPLVQLTVFAPTNAAFDALALALGTDLNGILALPNLADVLLYHVTSGEVLSTDLTNGNVEMLNGDNVIVDLSNGVQINDANVTTANIQADNGVIHVIDAVLLPLVGIDETTNLVTISTYPNPTTETIKVSNLENAAFEIIDMLGSTVKAGSIINNEINVVDLTNGTYMIRLTDASKTYQGRFIKR